MSKFLVIESGVNYPTLTPAKKSAKELSLKPSPDGSIVHISDMETGEIKATYFNGKQVRIGYVVTVYNVGTKVTSYLSEEESSNIAVFDTWEKADNRASEFLPTIPTNIFRLSVEQKIFEI